VKPLPNLSDESAMLLRGRLSTLGKERSETMIALRDAYTHLDGAAWAEVDARAQSVRSHVERLIKLAALWLETVADTNEASMKRDQE
jgi:hypothetical protein